MAWRVARSLLQLRDQVNAKWPNRSKASDGSIGDPGHSSRESDHNPNPAGVVCAIDITHDPKHGFDSYAFADMLLKKQDPRMAYVISNRRIGSGPAGPSPGKWRKYTGTNAHDHHVHISVKQTKAQYDSVKVWNISGVPDVPPEVKAAAPVVPPTLRKGDKGPDVQTLQGRLNANGLRLKVDGDFGPVTFAAVKKFQTSKKLISDGVAGPQTMQALPAIAPGATALQNPHSAQVS